MKQVELSLVVSVFNEAEMLPLFWAETWSILQGLPGSWEVVFVNDGSSDGSGELLAEIAAGKERVRIVNLSRNFGHEAAMLAGIDHCRGNAVICLDADLQHPPALIPEMLAQHRAGKRIVHMVREDSVERSWSQQLKSRLFYVVLNGLSPEGFVANASDFFLLDRRVCEVLRQEYRERARFLRGIIQTVGFSKSSISFVAPRRAAGNSKYSFLQLCNLSISALATFSRLPLRLALLLGVICGLFSIGVGIYSLIMKMMLGNVISGYTTIVVLISFLFAVQFFVLGIIGEYLGFIFEEVKRRPIYVVESCLEKSAHGPS
ncbi:MAG: glycosyl transferase family 2 [Desulfuromonadales bacterium GWD2_61_12]|nr:MAG: glycosyl transferase family 2 [Desulfuromonadales bacterium GWC2_61_20]OGR33919.1 MAG: glycosyl transferase family 2 [Desulfuromonadales bacterium GWD2_61_12]HAD03424.1 glycosyl transferase family 2 [Desulfuromonas sp.]HBT82081.1 glycosyl transferase family 2 [Desulfuromonas sp.]